jgi:hypothetical protein
VPIARADARHPASDASEVITVTPHGAGYGDPATNSQVEQAAIKLVTEEFAGQGWNVTDVSLLKVGWDVTVTRGAEVGHLEVKGVSGVKPTILLTHNEHACALNDPHWKLAVVTQALTSPALAIFEAQLVVDACTPHLYKARLTS